MRLLLDANVSPKCAVHFAAPFGFDAVSLYDVLAPDASDEAIVQDAATHRRVVTTFDVGFGELFDRFERGRLGVIVLRVADQMAEPTNRALDRLFTSAEAATSTPERSLVIVDDRRIRVSTATLP